MATKRITVPSIVEAPVRGDRLVMVTAYDFPQGRTAFSGASQKSIGTAIRAFIIAARQHEATVGATVAARAQELLAAFEAADVAQGQAAKITNDGRQAIKADQRALAVLLFANYGSLLSAFAADPAQAATYFDFTKLPSTTRKTPLVV